MRRLMIPLLLSSLVALAHAGASRADDDEHEHEHDHERRRRTRAVSAPPPSAELSRYKEECGACHLAYPPGLLPTRSWSRLLSGLDDHFGDNAELDGETQAALSRWLERYAAESSSHRLSTRVVRDAAGDTPLRISELPVIRRQHHELSSRVFARAKVGGRANCAACHTTAERWVFDEDRVKVPR